MAAELQLADVLGPTQVLFGSDYPHPEGLGNPTSYLDELTHLDEGLVRQIMGGNLARLLGLAGASPEMSEEDQPADPLAHAIRNLRVHRLWSPPR